MSILIVYKFENHILLKNELWLPSYATATATPNPGATATKLSNSNASR